MPSTRAAAGERRTGVFALGAAVVVALSVFTLLGYQVVHRPGVTRADLSVSRWFADHRTPPVTALAWFFTGVGGVIGMTTLTIVLTLWLARRRQFTAATLVAAAMILQAISVTLIKLVVARPRPPQDLRTGPDVFTRSFPSGHTTAATVFFGLVAILAVRHFRGRLRIVVPVGCGLFALGVAMSRVYLGYHYPTDILGGWLLGASVLSVAVLSVALLTNRRTATRRNGGPPIPAGAGSEQDW